ncbi:MAG: C_GCAxxG_C_C family protein [candidate division Zixibacteria bacterium]|nr:C_GCAxxG_C_C family protein [candidate division Zixibacteria bacterium]NIR67789.1 C_GCAxxG_C_C family protein [candidate division Zixibacteria bacterium]NIS17024.1 C_GCAxxG_C_C family protein [candidate division Zixibacteria bacterium]NIS49021.1 C_GCAxxG_C_C family protein [candidate division Zixibacteria bacterium]NIT53397.1 C_GCAxxG_C_C family protein [candidate division Zixibacteria bacterium]
MCRDYNIENDLIPKIATCFGGGIGNSGSVCGAVIGAAMAIGIVRKQSTSIEEWLATAEIAREFRRRFEEEMKTIYCRELTGLDLTKDLDSEKLMNSDIAMNVCFPAVAHAYRIVSDLLKDNS